MEIDDLSLGGRSGNSSRNSKNTGSNRMDDDLSIRSNNTGRGSSRGSNNGRNVRNFSGNNDSSSRNAVPSGKKTLNLPLLIASLVISLIGGIVGLIVYGLLIESLPRPFVIGIVMLVFFLIMIVGMLGFIAVQGRYTFREGLIKQMLYSILCALAIFVLATLFEFIYQLGGEIANAGPTSYIILLDDSGSMDSNDPNDLRYAAISEIMADKDEDFSYAVYSFNDDLLCIREMSAKGTEEVVYSKPDGRSGGTSIKNALTSIIEAIEDGSIDGGSAPKVLLLSDGYATDIGLFSNIKKLLKRYTSHGVSISTVGLGDSVDESLMTQIANGTGGVFISVDEGSNLGTAMEAAISSYAKRDLLTLRNTPKLNALFFIERILFMSVLGLGMQCFLILVSGIPTSDQKLSWFFSILTCILAGLAIELLINTIYLPEKLSALIYFVLTGMFLAIYRKKEPRRRSVVSENERSTYEEKSEEANRIGKNDKRKHPEVENRFGNKR
ncbi:MAG: VWA domain-containing protein [Lachnospiraceae bacterium]|nr:VWA domain-containing protein [Lachnospiraceae bacterium]